ncbi:Glu-tRNA(Gln) amidotransferase subunit GatE [Candidatus Pacearchaeota archaeon]|nr:Glu-tRNA(Gln) amidotransferase subunit GatE [Candidatus Pacearchaeota archaeon]
MVNNSEKESKKVEMRAGLEIHQQLDTGKLFCRCPSILRNDEPDWVAHRKLHAVAGESGEIDRAAKHEASKEKEFIYQGYKDSCCLIEFDEQPPFEIDKEALKVAMQIALLLNCEILPVTQIMRKTVIDGSNTSGFQRTLLLARKGWIETSKGKVGIETVCLEEDAARIIEKKDNKVIYRLDRLGIPLVEIATSPELYFPEQVKEAALKLGDILRACKVKRGIGTIRQDVNVSTPGHPRVEIKGFQEPRIMIKTIELEIERQKKEVQETNKKKTKIEGHVRKSNEDGSTSFLRPMPGADRMYPETDLPLLHISRDLINEVKNNLPKLRSDIRGELKQKGLNEEMIKLVLGENKLEEFEALLGVYNNPGIIAKTLLILPKEIASHEKISEEKISSLLNMDVLESVLGAVNSKKINESEIKHVLESIAKGKSLKEALNVEKIDIGDIETEAAKIVKEKPGLNIGAYMGLIMAKFKGKISGKEVNDILQKLIK